MSFLNVLEKIGSVALPLAGQVAGGFNPAIGGIINLASNSIIKAEQNHAGDKGAGASKKTEVMADMQIFAPAIALAITQATGSKVDEAQLTAIISKLIDDLVALLNVLAVVAPAKI